MLTKTDRVVAFLNRHTLCELPTVVRVKGETVVVRSLESVPGGVAVPAGAYAVTGFGGDGSRSFLVESTIPATFEAARDFLGY